MKKETLIKRVEAMIRELDEYYKATDHSEVPDIETTVIGAGGFISYSIGKTQITRSEKYGSSTYTDKYRIGNEIQEEELLEQMKYDRRRIKKGWRVWRSENPDLELEKDDEE